MEAADHAEATASEEAGLTAPSGRRRNLWTHLTAALVVPACGALCFWQVTRALSGNTLSWAYVFEWPIFGAYAVFLWWKLIHEAPGPPRAAAPVAAPPAAGGPPDGDSTGAGPGHPDDDETEDDELAAYNRYLAALHASGRRKGWRRGRDTRA